MDFLIGCVFMNHDLCACIAYPEVSCPIPKGIDHGFITFAVKREHSYKEKVKYGCSEHYVLDGPAEIHCDKTGNWSNKPVCRGMSDKPFNPH